jgi:hypothetical protein
MLKTKKVTHKGPGEPLQVTVSEASALMGMRRSVLISEALTYIREQREEEEPQEKESQGRLDNDGNLAVYLLRRYAWPDCIACTVASEGFDYQSLTFEEFCQLPEAFIGKWQEAAHELNPHWRGEEEEEESDEEEAAKKKEAEESPEESQSGAD